MKTNKMVLATALVTLGFWSWVLFSQAEDYSDLQRQADKLRKEEDLMKLVKDRWDRRQAVLTVEKLPGEKQGAVHQILKAAQSEFDLARFIKESSKAVSREDKFIFLKLLMPLTQQSNNELRELQKQVSTMAIDFESKERVLNMVELLIVGDDEGEESYAENLEINMKAGIPGDEYSLQLSYWAKEDPMAATKWMEEKIAEGSLDQVGLKDDSKTVLEFALLSGLVQKDIELALLCYKELGRKAKRQADIRMNSNIFENGFDLEMSLLWRELQEMKSQEEGASGK